MARGGVLEDTFWSPWPWPRRSSPWPWPRGLKSSKIGLSSAWGQHYFLKCWNFVEHLKHFLENVFLWRSLEKVLWRPFFFLESTCACVLGPWPWPRAFLSLALRVSVLGKAVLGLGFFFVSLALASRLLSSTPPLIMAIHFLETESVAMRTLRGL